MADRSDQTGAGALCVGPGRSVRPDRFEHAMPDDRPSPTIDPSLRREIERTLALLPVVPTVFTAAHDRARAGVMVRWLMRCASEPAQVCVAIERGQPIAPIVRDSRAFGLCIVDPRRKILLKKFECPEDAESDQFDSLETFSLVTGSPLLKLSLAVLDCVVSRHLDLDADHELYIGQVVSAQPGKCAGSDGQ